MLQEALVLFACASNKGCSETTTAYSVNNPQLVKNIELDTKKLINAVGPATVNALSPVIFFFAGGTSNVKLYESLYLQMNRQRGMIMLKKEFK